MENLLNMNKNLSLSFLVVLIIYGCTKDFVLQPISLKTTFQSSEPNLFTSVDGTTYLSFI